MGGQDLCFCGFVRLGRHFPHRPGATLMFAFLPLSLVMAAFDNLAWSVAAAYRSISFSVRCPEMAAISFADDPLSARRRMIALRRPCGTQGAGRPASSTAFFMSRVNVGRRMRRPLASPISVAPLAGEALIAARNTLVEQSGTSTIVVDFLIHHVWHCTNCSACFGSLAVFPAQTKSMRDIKTDKVIFPLLFPSLLVA